jgi:hypothetical protein
MLAMESSTLKSDKNGLDSGIIIPGYIIPYPPGVPLAVPGDVCTRRLRDEVARLERAGVDVFFLND